jgi:hypothetical protein
MVLRDRYSEEITQKKAQIMTKSVQFGPEMTETISPWSWKFPKPWWFWTRHNPKNGIVSPCLVLLYRKSHFSICLKFGPFVKASDIFGHIYDVRTVRMFMDKNPNIRTKQEFRHFRSVRKCPCIRTAVCTVPVRTCTKPKTKKRPGRSPYPTNYGVAILSNNTYSYSVLVLLCFYFLRWLLKIN